MLEAIPNVLYLFLNKLLLLFLDMKLSLPIVCENEVIDVLDKFLRNVFQTLEPATQ